MRLERLERMAEKFDKKAGMRANWLIENHKLVSQVDLTVLVHCPVYFVVIVHPPGIINGVNISYPGFSLTD